MQREYSDQTATFRALMDAIGSGNRERVHYFRMEDELPTPEEMRVLYQTVESLDTSDEEGVDYQCVCHDLFSRKVMGRVWEQGRVDILDALCQGGWIPEEDLPTLEEFVQGMDSAVDLRQRMVAAEDHHNREGICDSVTEDTLDKPAPVEEYRRMVGWLVSREAINLRLVPQVFRPVAA